MPSIDSVSRQDLVVCMSGEQEYTARDAIDAAIFRDELELELDESAISAAAEQFRYQHDLITAEETEAWLANRSLTLDDFSDHFARQYCAGTLSDGFSPEQIEYGSADSELRELFVAE